MSGRMPLPLSSTEIPTVVIDDARPITSAIVRLIADHRLASVDDQVQRTCCAWTLSPRTCGRSGRTVVTCGAG
jgi:hypothetical protein